MKTSKKQPMKLVGITTHIPLELKLKLETLAKREKKSVYKLLQSALMDYFDYESPNKEAEEELLG